MLTSYNKVKENSDSASEVVRTRQDSGTTSSAQSTPISSPHYRFVTPQQSPNINPASSAASTPIRENPTNSSTPSSPVHSLSDAHESYTSVPRLRASFISRLADGEQMAPLVLVENVSGAATTSQTFNTRQVSIAPKNVVSTDSATQTLGASQLGSGFSRRTPEGITFFFDLSKIKNRDHEETEEAFKARVLQDIQGSSNKLT